jgi:PAS domain S-box-containing protein
MFGTGKSAAFAGHQQGSVVTRAQKLTLRRRFSAWLDHGSIAQRLGRGQFMLSITVLGVVIAGFLLCQITGHYFAARRASVALSSLAAETLRPALAHPATAPGLLVPLLAQKEIRALALYLPDGRQVAKGGAAAAELPAQTAQDTRLGAGFGWSRLVATSEIRDARGRAGLALLQYDLAPFWQRTELDALVALAVFCAGLAVAWFVSRRLRPAIVAPYHELSAVVDSINLDGPTKFIEAPRGNPTVERLIEALHGFSRQLKNRDEDLRHAREELEEAAHNRLYAPQPHVETKHEATAAAQESDTRYRNLFENNPVPMFVMDLETLQFVAVNHSALKHYGYSEEQFLRLSLPTLTHGKDPLEVIRAFRREAKSFDAGEWQHRRRQGEVIDMQLTAHAIVFDNKVAKVVLANDVTERNRAQRQLQDMHQQLVAASRRAGMAEVATDVLHNVGNVLNSVNVSAAMLVTGVRSSKVGAMQKVSDLFASNRTDLGAFLGPDGKGRKMPDYLATLAGELARERDGYLTELELLVRNIEHIKQVVAFQQNHAKVANMFEVQSARALVEEALRITAGDFSTEGIAAHIECPPQGCDVHTDHHKVLQILINLMTNACQAMITIPIAERRLLIRIAPAGPAHVSIAVRDTGCGIKPECLTSIFNHGFTTKKSGHGFGLHGAANSAKELGGTLSAASEGPGTGATFTLELPLALPPARATTSQAA